MEIDSCLESRLFSLKCLQFWGKQFMQKINRLGVVESSVSPLTCVNCTKMTNPHTNNHTTMDLNMAVSCNTDL